MVVTKKENAQYHMKWKALSWYLSEDRFSGQRRRYQYTITVVDIRRSQENLCVQTEGMRKNNVDMNSTIKCTTYADFISCKLMRSDSWVIVYSQFWMKSFIYIVALVLCNKHNSNTQQHLTNSRQYIK